jgi:hypothetical protein
VIKRTVSPTSAGATTVSGTVGTTEGGAATSTATVTATPAVAPPPSNRFTFTTPRKKSTGVVTFKVRLPGPGVLEILETVRTAYESTLRPGSGKFAFGQLRVVRGKGGLFTVTVRPTARGKRFLRTFKGKIYVTVSIRFTPTGGTSRTTNPVHVRVR